MNKVTLFLGWVGDFRCLVLSRGLPTRGGQKKFRERTLRQLPARHVFSGQNLRGEQARRFAGRAAHEIRVGDQSQDCKKIDLTIPQKVLARADK